MLTADQFQTLFPKCVAPQEWSDTLSIVLPEHGIDTAERVAAFVSQCGVETGGWRWFEENMNYSADRMTVVWPRIFTPELAKKCHRNPELVANHAYANRMGNGNPASGDGWKFRGRGPIHLTGRNNYTQFATEMFANPDEILDNPDLVAQEKEISILSAVWFWRINNLNALADKQDIQRLSRRVNGGTNGLHERLELFEKVYAVLSQ